MVAVCQRCRSIYANNNRYCKYCGDNLVLTACPAPSGCVYEITRDSRRFCPLCGRDIARLVESLVWVWPPPVAPASMEQRPAPAPASASDLPLCDYLADGVPPTKDKAKAKDQDSSLDCSSYLRGTREV